MKLLARLGMLLGLTLMIVLIVRAGGPELLGLLSQAGGVVLWLVPLHAVPLLLDVCGWRTLLGTRGLAVQRPPLAVLWWIAAVREAINRLLPVANIGGEIVGIRLLAARGVEGTVAAASVTMEVLLTLFSQYLFAALGIALASQAIRGVAPLAGLLLGMAATLPFLLGLTALLRYGSVFQRFESLIERVIGVRAQIAPILSRSADLDAALRTLYAERARLAATVGWQFLGLAAGALETWLALRWIGHPRDIEDSLALESLTQAVRNFAFLVPSGLGVQEASLVGFGALIGLSPTVSITLSLVKRLREIVFGVPVLASWQFTEGLRGWAVRR